jgi:hypothetical protein
MITTTGASQVIWDGPPDYLEGGWRSYGVAWVFFDMTIL